MPGFRLEPDEDADRTPFDDGMIRQERKYDSALNAVRIVALIDDANLAAFRQWARGFAHAWFDFPTPLATGTIRARVRGGAGAIGYQTARSGAGRIRWEASLVIEGPDL